MKRITAFVGSARKKHTYAAVVQLLEYLEQLGDIEYEIFHVADCHIELCLGCKLCFEKGEEACPHKDDRGVLVEKMMESDGVVFASPSYMFQVSGLMKAFIDRLAYIGHRPRFFGKTFTSVVTQGLFGGGKIVKYLDFVGACLGFKTVRGVCITALEPMTDRESQRIARLLAKQSKQFHRSLVGRENPAPSLMMLAGFRMGRASMQANLDERSLDYRYYAENGWFESDYYYPTQLGPLKKLVGRLFDFIGRRMAQSRKQSAKNSNDSATQARHKSHH